jgi:hypothetical protein
MSNLDEQIRLHSAGATVRHKLFEDLQSYKNNFELTQEFMDTWVVPFYMRIGEEDSKWIELLEATRDKITKEVVATLLGDFNWRTRQVGAYFAAIKDYQDLIDIIGVHLLKSEVTYAGRIYCWALATFNTAQCVDYIDRYLEFYLLKLDLWFDQADAINALAYLDKVNKTNKLEKYLNNWSEFLKNKPYWKKEITTEEIEKQLKIISYVREKGGR